MREKLIELCERSLNNDGTGHEMRFVGGDVTPVVRRGVTIQKWIPVTERLPEDEGWYQVYTAPDKGYKSINKAMFRKGFEWNNFTPYWHGAGGTWGNVTHWMPLPEPPKEVE